MGRVRVGKKLRKGVGKLTHKQDKLVKLIMKVIQLFAELVAPEQCDNGNIEDFTFLAEDPVREIVNISQRQWLSFPGGLKGKSSTFNTENQEHELFVKSLETFLEKQRKSFGLQGRN